MLLANPFAGDRGGLADHVLAGGVAGGEVEPQVEEATEGVLLDVAQPSRTARGVSHLLDGSEVPHDPFAETAGGSSIVKAEDGGTLHGVVTDRGLHAPYLTGELHSSVVAGNERSLRRSEWDQELTLSVLAPHAQRAGDPDRHLGHADEFSMLPGKSDASNENALTWRSSTPVCWRTKSRRLAACSSV